jgi:hypothetical protein
MVKYGPDAFPKQTQPNSEKDQTHYPRRLYRWKPLPPTGTERALIEFSASMARHHQKE